VTPVPAILRRSAAAAAVLGLILTMPVATRAASIDEVASEQSDAVTSETGASTADDKPPAESKARFLWRTLTSGELSGFVSGELRLFWDSPLFPGQSTQPADGSLAVQPEYRYEWRGGKDRLAIVPFYRLDSMDRKRTHWDLRELNWLHAADTWDLRFGNAKVFWGVAESRHLVDIINQTDQVEDIDAEEKLGQPMLKLGFFRDWGTVELFYLPRFRERTFPGRRGRLRFALPVDTGRAQYESPLGVWNQGAAVRWSHVFGDWDIGLSHFYGASREPRFLLPFDDTAHLVPFYDNINQTGMDIQVTKESWLWKLESIAVGGYPAPWFAAVVGGFEYTFYGVFDTIADLGAIAEYNYDGRVTDLPVGPVDDVAPPPGVPLPPGLFRPLGNAPPSIFQNDMFGGLRLTLNDAQSTELLAGGLIDLDTASTFFSVEASRRIRDRWTVEIELRTFLNVDPRDLIFNFRNDDFVQIRLARYF
jgi:hypothetical protein